MLVCHKWYAIASYAASLWTDIDFAQQRTFAPVLLTRSLGACVHLCGSLPSREKALETSIRNNGARIRELDLWALGPMPAWQSILAVDMPRIRVLCLSCSCKDQSVLLIGAPASFPALRAMLLESFLFVPAHVLPQLTHLHLAKLVRVNAANMLDLLRNTPALQLLDINSGDLIVPLNLTTVSSPVALPRLHSAHISRLASAAVHHLMVALAVPHPAFLDLSNIFASGGTLSSTPLLPDALTRHTMRRLAFDMDNNFKYFRTAFHGNDVSLTLKLTNVGVPHSERAQWAFTDFPTMLPLSGIEEFHFQVLQQWEAPQDLLPHLSAYMPAVSTLLIKHDPGTEEEDADGYMVLARTVARILESDNPVLFPNLAHLELIVTCIPLAFCALIARALARRDRDGRRLRKLRIRIDDDYTFQWKMKWMGMREQNYKKTDIFDHVDSGEISDDFLDDGSDTHRLGWGSWKDCVQRARHGYWQE